MLKLGEGTIANELKGRSQPTRTVDLATATTGVIRSPVFDRSTLLDNDTGSNCAMVRTSSDCSSESAEYTTAITTTPLHTCLPTVVIIRASESQHISAQSVRRDLIQLQLAKIETQTTAVAASKARAMIFRWVSASALKSVAFMVVAPVALSN
jgi:hypothetical protein